MNEIQFGDGHSVGCRGYFASVGMNLFVVFGTSGVSTLKIAARAVPLALCMFVAVLMIAYVSAISTTLFPEIYK